ncbi:MAG: nucleoside triphosphate pyrophosphohydrolase [Chloroflexi bacterium]|nr:nucleoside triphosphate pyrophosphohydrolase [Chloroflexota bacterium]
MNKKTPEFSDEELGEFETFRKIIKRLRGPGGCPWDRQQTHDSLKPYLVEECYEVLETIEDNDMSALSEELGDLWLQIMLHARIAEESGEFKLGDILRNISSKMIKRHPHVFGDTKVKNAEEVSLNWEEIKGQEKNGCGSLLDGIPKGLPSLACSQDIGRRVASAGFDWEKADDIMDKLVEEVGELKRASTHEEKVHEFGDILLVLANAARHMDIELESALRQANARFIRRFRYIEDASRQKGMEIKLMTLAEMDQLWDEAKKELG